MRERVRLLKEILCKLLVKVWVALSLAALGFLFIWLCLAVIIFEGLSLA